MQNNISFKGAEYRDDFRERAAIAMPPKRRVTPLELISYPRLRAPSPEHKSDADANKQAQERGGPMRCSSEASSSEKAWTTSSRAREDVGQHVERKLEWRQNGAALQLVGR